MSTGTATLDEAFTAFASDPAARADPYPFFRRLRQEAPVYRSPIGVWYLTSHAACSAALRDPRMSSDRIETTYGSDPSAWGADARMKSKMLIMMDAPDHTRLRRLVSHAFRPGEIERGWHTRIVDLARELLAGGPEDFDVVRDFSFPLTRSVISEMLGIFGADMEQFQHWIDVTSATAHPTATAEDVRLGDEAAEQLTEAFIDLIDERRRHPGDDLISLLLAAEEDGERLTFEEVVSTAQMVFAAGFETTANLIPSGIATMLADPDTHRMVADDPDLLIPAVEETLRYETSAPFTLPRIAREPMVVDGTEVPAGDRVVAVLAAANRDPAVFADPDRFDVTRDTGNGHLGFALGPHFCIGAALARTEGKVAFEALLALPGLRLETDELQWKEPLGLRGLATLPVTWQR